MQTKQDVNTSSASTAVFVCDKKHDVEGLWFRTVIELWCCVLLCFQHVLLRCAQVLLWNLDSGSVTRKLLAPGLLVRPQGERAVESLAFMHGDLK